MFSDDCTESQKRRKSKLERHHLGPEIISVSDEVLKLVLTDEHGWQLFSTDLDTKLYRKELVVNNLVQDPFKAVSRIQGVTGKELCEYFFNPEFRLEWDSSIQSSELIETIDQNTSIFYQLHKTIWPLAPRDVLFWSHRRTTPKDEERDEELTDAWVVVNHSTQMALIPDRINNNVRMTVIVCLICRTLGDPSKCMKELTRNDICCEMTYYSSVNVGGWAPSRACRKMFKREYPKFIRKLSSGVYNTFGRREVLF